MIGNTNGLISREVIQQIHDTASLIGTIENYVELKPSGSSKVGTCPSCGGVKKMSVNEKKHIWKCYRCDIGGNNAISFLVEAKGMKFLDAVHHLAAKYSIDLHPERTEKQQRTKGNRLESFRNTQLKESGIPDKYQKYFVSGAKNASYELDRYQAATKNKHGQVIPGDDMILNYLDLEGNPIEYKPKNKKAVPFTRVRWRNPELHPDKNNKPMKYASPYQSGSHIWIPNYIIKAYKDKQIIDTLIICEGEKKADALCLIGIPAVGVQGINNFAASNEMPHMFESMIKRFAVEKVMFLFDSDWKDISTSKNKPLDQRPKSFFKAASKFRNYFNAFAHEGYPLDIYIAATKDPVYKGIDDLIVRELKDEAEKVLTDDFKEVLNNRDGKGKYLEAINVTSMSDYQLKELWDLHSHQAFIKTHEAVLKELKVFKIGKLTRRYNADTDSFEIDEKILPSEQFWSSYVDKNDNIRTNFLYQEMRIFLRNRGYGIYKTVNKEYRFVKIENKVVTEIDHRDIEQYILGFLEEINEKNALEMILKGGSQYLGPNNLSRIYPRNPDFSEADKKEQYIFFKDVYWKISEDAVEQHPIKNLPKHIWDKQQIQFNPKYIGKPLVTINRNDDHWGKIEKTNEAMNSDFFNFIDRTSQFHWKKSQILQENEEGRKEWMKYPLEEVTDEDIKTYREHLAAKMAATGYVLHEYRDYSMMKAIIAMDGLLSEVGKSQGGSGKSIWSTSFEHLQPTVVIDAKKKNLEDDKFLYDNVDERTKSIVFDDCRVNINFEHFFSQITRGIKPEKKGEGKTVLPPVRMIFNTNHAFNMEGTSFKRRVFYIGFSDYYNEYRSVGQDFGHQLFHEWDWNQWNLFYNWMATCIQFYLKHSLRYPISGDNLHKRKLRQQIGENFIEWMETMNEVFVNKKLEKAYITERYLRDYPTDRKYVTQRKIKIKLQKYAEYCGYEFNPQTQGERIRINGAEYFTLADKDFDANKVDTIDSDASWSTTNIYNKAPF